MNVSPLKIDEDEVQRQSEAVVGACQILSDIASLQEALKGVDATAAPGMIGSIGIVLLPDSEDKPMIRIRVKPNHITLRIGDAAKQRYASAIHALHVIRVAVVEQGMAIEDTAKTQQALAACVTRAREELAAAIGDVLRAAEDRGYYERVL